MTVQDDYLRACEVELVREDDEDDERFHREHHRVRRELARRCGTWKRPSREEFLRRSARRPRDARFRCKTTHRNRSQGARPRLCSRAATRRSMRSAKAATTCGDDGGGDGARERRNLGARFNAAWFHVHELLEAGA